jgi:hypothetical protein
MHGFVKINRTTNTRRSKHSERACNNCGFIRESIAEKIFCQDYIESEQVRYQMHDTGINVKMFERDDRHIIFEWQQLAITPEAAPVARLK